MWYYFTSAIKQSFDFKTRATRKQFWMYQLNVILLLIILFIISGVIALLPQSDGTLHAGVGIMICSIIADVFYCAVGLFYLYLIIPNLAIHVRRLHDINHSGWMLLLFLVPLVGGIVIFVFMCTKSDPVANKYGPAPESMAVKTADQTA